MSVWGGGVNFDFCLYQGVWVEGLKKDSFLRINTHNEGIFFPALYPHVMVILV